MKKELAYNPPPLTLQQGYTIDLHFDGVDEMERDDDNWEHHCNYQLLPGALKGHHRGLQLRTMQISFAQRPVGGMMYYVGTAKDCITFALVETCDGVICFDRLKLREGDIVFFDDSRRYSFSSSGGFSICTLNMQTASLNVPSPPVLKALMHTIRDTDGAMAKTLHAIWARFAGKNKGKADANDFSHAEEEIRLVLYGLLAGQMPKGPRLTKGEETALAVRDKILHHMDGRFSVATLAEEFHVSEKTLQNSFRSLFGFTPSRFLRSLKLNHVHHELRQSTPEQRSVSGIAQKWGFTQMGHFSKYYKALFGESPSHTLRSSVYQDPALNDGCASRKEEME
jgi:AraC-like DNA-binding protein